jgi:hypothetical protein
MRNLIASLLSRLDPRAPTTPSDTRGQSSSRAGADEHTDEGSLTNNRWAKIFARTIPEFIDVSTSRLVQGDSGAIELLRSGANKWNQWRENNWTKDSRAEWPNLYRGNFEGLDLSHVNLWGSNLEFANFAGANLSNANLEDAILKSANLKRANLQFANLSNANLMYADLSEADLRDSLLPFANICSANLEGANISGSLIFGISAWDVNLDDTNQQDLLVTRYGEPIVTTDNIGLGQLMYLLLKNTNLRDILDELTSKTVLILGRFTPDRKEILDAIREELRRRDYLPIMFDFEGPASRDITETISTLAHMARFVIADITDARSIPQELLSIVPNLPSVPVQPLLLRSQSEYGMFEHFRRFPWVLDAYHYDNKEQLLQSIDTHVITPPERRLLDQSISTRKRSEYSDATERDPTRA